MDAPPHPVAPPTTPGKIPDPRAGRLPIAAKVVAILDIVFGAFMLLPIPYAAGPTDPYMLAFGLFLPLGIGVLLKSNVVRVLARIAHGLIGVAFILAVPFTIFFLLASTGQGQPAPGVPMVAIMAFLTAWTLGLTAFFVWGFFVLGRKDVRAACRRKPK